MNRAYKIKYFNKDTGDLGIEFEGKGCYNFVAPYKNGAYLSGEALEEAIQLLYPYMDEEKTQFFSSLTGGEELASKVEAIHVQPLDQDAQM